MALPKEVQAAVDGMFSTIYDPDCIGYQRLAVIRAHLLSQDEEIARLESAWHVDTLNGKDRIIALQEAENDRVKSRLAAADALLREIRRTLILPSHLQAIQAHLQGAGDEG